MQFRELPVTDFVILSNDVERLSRALMSAMPVKPFTHFGIIKGGENSMRIFAQGECMGGEMVPLARPLYAFHVAIELLRLTNTNEARYERALHPSMARGWEIRKGHLGRNPVIVAYAKWV